MKVSTLIILEKDTTDLDQAIEDKLSPYKNDKWDYWTIFDHNHIKDAKKPDNLISEEEELLLCTSYIDPSIEEFSQLAVVVDLAGKWHDIENFGWTLLGEKNNEKKSEKGAKKWKKHLSKIVKKNKGLLGVIITIHI